MKTNNFIYEKYPQEISLKLYELQKDMDWMDYEEDKEKILNNLENALYHLKSLCENPYNNDYFRTFYNVLENL